tara:strand:+ start:2428 stop:2700 length:273 start_codon:yes stop_codon:yes gene_type:complete
MKYEVQLHSVDYEKIYVDAKNKKDAGEIVREMILGSKDNIIKYKADLLNTSVEDIDVSIISIKPISSKKYEKLIKKNNNREDCEKEKKDK